MQTRAKLYLSTLLLVVTVLIGGGNSAEALGRTKLVLAFYYAWYDPSSFGSGKTPFQPLHPYYSTSNATILRQIKTAKAAGIDGFVQSWYGPNPNQQTEPNFKTALDLAQQNNFKMAVDFEVASPFFGGNQERISALQTLLKTHANHAAYLRVDNKPVIFFWANWVLPVNDWRYIRQQADPWNQTIWIAEGGHTDYLEVFDGLHLYNVAWSSNPAGINNRWSQETRAKADELGTFKYWVGTAMPGFNNSLVPGVEHTVRGRDNGSYLRKSFNGAAATNPDMIVLTSFNEWPEGSGIEPSKEFGTSYVEQMAQLVAAYKGFGGFPAIPAWTAPVPTSTPAPPPTPRPTATPWPTNTPRGSQVSDNAIVLNSASAEVATDSELDAQPQAIAVAPIAPEQSDGTYHTVQQGDTLIGIAVWYGVDYEQLLAVNGLSAESLLSIGQKVLLDVSAQQDYPPPEEATAIPPQPATIAPPPTPTSDPFFSTPTPQADGDIIYIVQPGDTLVGIATRFGYSIEQLNELYEINFLSQDDFLVVGQELFLGKSDDANVPQPESGVPPRYAGATYRESDNAYVHVVQAGETLIEIAVKYDYQTMDDFYEVSGLTGNSLITLGQEVIVGFKPQPQVTGGSSDLPTTTPLPPAAIPPTVTPTTILAPTRTPLPFPSIEATTTSVLAAAVATEASIVAEGEGISGDAISAASADPSSSSGEALGQAETPTENASSRSRLLALGVGGIGFLLIAAALGWYAWFNRQ